MPNGLAVAPDGKRLYVALGGENAIAVLDLVHRKRIGFIPTAWNPTDVDITRDGKRLVITSANAAGRRPRRCAGPYAVGDCSTGDLAYTTAAGRPSTKGGISVVRTPFRKKRLRKLTNAVLRNNRVKAPHRPQAEGARRDPPRHLRDQGEPHLRPGARQPRQGRRRPGADAVQRRLGAQPPRARAALHAVRQLLRRRRRVRRRPELDDLGGGERLRRQDVADHLLAGRAPAPPRARLRERLVRRAVPDRAAGVRPHDLPRRGGADPRLPVGQRVPPGRVVPRLRLLHEDPRRLPRRRQHVGHHAPRRPPLRRPRRRALPGFNLECSDHADRYPEWEREFRALRERLPRQPARRTRCRRSRSCGCPTTTPTARCRTRRSRRATSPTTTSRSASSSTRSRTARSGPTRRSSSPRTTPRTGPTTSTPTARSPT